METEDIRSPPLAAAGEDAGAPRGGCHPGGDHRLRRCGRLSVDAAEVRLPQALPLADCLHHGALAGGQVGRLPHGRRPRSSVLESATMSPSRGRRARMARLERPRVRGDSWSYIGPRVRGTAGPGDS